MITTDITHNIMRKFNNIIVIVLISLTKKDKDGKIYN